MSNFKIMSDRIICVNPVNDGVPSGGSVEGLGISIQWQNGELGRGEERKEPNGAFLDTVIYAALQKLESYQDSKFKCDLNETAVRCLKNALCALYSRTLVRENAGIEGTHKVD